MIKQLTPIIAILAIAGLVSWALYLGRDGVMLALSLSIISGLGGFEAKALISKTKK